MSDPETEEEPAAEPVKVKQVAIAGGLVAAALTAAVAFTVAGPLGLGIAAAGVAGTGYAAHRVRNPSNGTLMHSWLTRTRRTRTTTTKMGSLTWPFTGNQTRRALSKSGGSGKTRASKAGIGSGSQSTGRRRSGSTGPTPKSGKGSGLPLPKLTRSRARASAGGALPTHKASRAVPTRTKPTASSAGKPAGIRAPRTASRTAATPQRSASLTPRGPASQAKRNTGSGGRPVRRSSATGKTKPLSLTNSRSRHRPGLKRSTRGTSSGTRPTAAGRGRWNPFLGTRGGQNLGGRSTGSRKTSRARRLGGTLTGVQRRGPLGRLRHRVTPDRNRNTAPNRTRLRPRPYARRSAGSLLRTSLRVPVRNRSKPGSRRVTAPFKRPSLRQAKRARRTLRLRSGVHLRHGAAWLAKTPARRWDRLWGKLPTAPLPITHYTEKHGMKVPAGPKHKTPAPDRPLADIIPITRNTPSKDITLMPIQRNGETIYVSSPIETITEAFQQLASFHPGSAMEVEQVAAAHAEMFNEVGRAYSVWADNLTNGQPFEQPFADSIREIGVAIAATGSIAQNAHQTMRAAHAPDFKRIEDPRPDEGMWNPEANR